MSKKQKKEKKDSLESELEEKIKEKENEEDFDIRENQFVESLSSLIQNPSIVLEKVETPKQEINLEEQVGFTESPEKNETEKPEINYDLNKNYNASLDKDYNLNVPDISPSEIKILPTTRVVIENAGKDIRPQTREVRMPVPEFKNPFFSQSSNSEIDYVVRAEKIQDEGSHLPFEKKETKYKGRVMS